MVDAFSPSLTTLPDGSAVLALPALVGGAGPFSDQCIKQVKDHMLLLNTQAYGFALLEALEDPRVENLRIYPDDYSWDDTSIEVMLYGPNRALVSSGKSQKLTNTLNDMRQPAFREFLEVLSRKGHLDATRINAAIGDFYDTHAQGLGMPGWEQILAWRQGARLEQQAPAAPAKAGPRL